METAAYTFARLLDRAFVPLRIGPISAVGGLHLTGVLPPRAVRRWAFEARRLSARLRWRGRHRPGPTSGDDVSVAHRVVPHCEFEHPEEHHSAASGVASVEAEYELVQVAGQMRVIDRAMHQRLASSLWRAWMAPGSPPSPLASLRNSGRSSSPLLARHCSRFEPASTVPWVSTLTRWCCSTPRPASRWGRKRAGSLPRVETWSWTATWLPRWLTGSREARR